jgi:hypothetical protein
MQTHDVTIAGHVFSVPLRYEAGHVITEGEASALNQTLCENVRNNLAPKIKKEHEALGEGQSLNVDDWQTKVTEYGTSYEFGVRGVSVAVDPLDAEIQRMAKAAVKLALGEAIKAKNPKYPGKLKDYEDQIPGLVAGLLSGPRGDKIRKDAERNLKDKRNTAASLFDSLTAQS